jgi:ABC-type cobalamin transport system ATPase subunit
MDNKKFKTIQVSETAKETLEAWSKASGIAQANLIDLLIEALTQKGTSLVIENHGLKITIEGNSQSGKLSGEVKSA